MKHKKILSIFVIILFSIFSFVGFVKASVLGFDTSTPCNYWEDVFNFSMSVAGILTLIMLVLGGFYYILSLGQEEKLGNAKNMMTGAMAGFFLALFSYLIFQVISPSLLQCRLDIPEVILPEPLGDSSSNSGSNSGSGGASDPCAGLHEDDLFDEQIECETSGGPDNGRCEGNCVQQQANVSSNTDTSVDTDTDTDTDTSDTSNNSDQNRRWCCTANDSGLYSQMMSFCSSGGSSGNRLENYRNVINGWRSILPGRAVYVGGGTMHGGTCNASSSDTYLSRKLQSGTGYRSQWVDPVGGDINQAMNNYRTWAQSLGGTYCGDCLTFTRTLYQCVGVANNVIAISANRGSATNYFNNPREFANALQNNTVEISPGSFIWIGGDCGHAINYTGISGAEVIEMGGGGGAITVNGHRASTVRVTASLQSHASSSWYSNRNCPIYVHNMLD